MAEQKKQDGILEGIFGFIGERLAAGAERSRAGFNAQQASTELTRATARNTAVDTLQRFAIKIPAGEQRDQAVRRFIQDSPLSNFVDVNSAPAGHFANFGETDLTAPEGTALTGVQRTGGQTTAAFGVPKAPQPLSTSNIVVGNGQQGTVTDNQFTPITGPSGQPLAATQKQLLGTVPGEAVGLEGGAATQAQKDILSLNTRIVQLKGIKQQLVADPTLIDAISAIQGQATQIAEDFRIDKTPIGDFLKKHKIIDPVKNQKVADFIASAQQAFLPFRKFITGVAGGMQEFKNIEKAFPTDKDSFSEWMGKFDAAIRAAEITSNVLQIALTDGVISNKELNIENATPEQQAAFKKQMAPVFKKISDAGLTTEELAPARQGEGVDQLIQRSSVRKFITSAQAGTIAMVSDKGDLVYVDAKRIKEAQDAGFKQPLGF